MKCNEGELKKFTREKRINLGKIYKEHVKRTETNVKQYTRSKQVVNQRIITEGYNKS